MCKGTRRWNEQWHDEDAEWIHSTRMINMMGLTSQMTSQPGEAEKTNEVSKEQLLAINDRLNQIRK